MDTRTSYSRGADVHHNPRSTAQIAGHPLHPMLIPFPIAFLIGGFVADIVFLNNANAGWVIASEWLIGAGVVTALIAAIAGLTDVAGERRIRDLNIAWYHAGGNVLAVLISAYNFYIRYTLGEASIRWTGFVLSLVVVAILITTGWLGGEMVYRHRVGVQDH